MSWQRGRGCLGREEGGDLAERKGVTWQRGRGCLGREEGGDLAEKKLQFCREGMPGNPA